MTILTAKAALLESFEDVIETGGFEFGGSTADSITLFIGGYKLVASGTNFTFIEGFPVSGTISSVKVFKGDVEQYSITDFSVALSQNLDEVLSDLKNIFNGPDTINGSNFGDTIFGFSGNDTVSGNGGIDKIYGQIGNDTLRGNLGGDTIYGGWGADTIFGGDNNDLIYGGLGHDMLEGDLGRDQFYFTDPIKNGTTFGSWDELKDFNATFDSIHLESSVYAKLLAVENGTVGPLLQSQFSTGTDNTANDADNYLIYNKSTGALWYDSNGSAANTSSSIYTKIAELDLGTGHPNLGFEDIFLV